MFISIILYIIYTYIIHINNVIKKNFLINNIEINLIKKIV